MATAAILAMAPLPAVLRADLATTAAPALALLPAMGADLGDGGPGPPCRDHDDRAAWACKPPSHRDTRARARAHEPPSDGSSSESPLSVGDHLRLGSQHTGTLVSSPLSDAALATPPPPPADVPCASMSPALEGRAAGRARFLRLLSEAGAASGGWRGHGAQKAFASLRSEPPPPGRSNEIAESHRSEHLGDITR